MLHSTVIGAILDLFPGVPRNDLSADIRLVRDRQGYAIKPHTDIKSKVISLLFYLPKDESNSDAGTTVMTPKQAGFTSDGTRRYEFADFNDVYTAPFSPNTMFGFPRSDVSFHGVHPTSMQQRDVLLLNIYRFKRPQT
jgi:hypothetical protein